MADEKKATTAGEVTEGKVMTKDSITKSQAEYKGDSHFDLVEVKIVKDNGFYKVGDVDQVHPATAALMKERGVIADTGKAYKRPEFKQTDITVDA